MWYNSRDVLPEAGQRCWLSNGEQIYPRPIVFSAEMGHVWFDFAATYDAAISIDPKETDVWWTPEGNIPLPED